jgi:hypothetical protein
MSYELKSKLMSNLAHLSMLSTDAITAYRSTLEVVHSVYSRATAKRLNRSERTVILMLSSLRKSGHHDVAEAIERSLPKAAVALEMVANDLRLTIRKVLRQRVVEEASKLIGEHDVNGHDRIWAETGDRTTSKWIKFYTVASVFGTSLEPIIDYAYIGRESDSVASPFDNKASKASRLKSRTKVKYSTCSQSNSSVGSQTHSRSSYGVETQPGRRHGVSMLPDPSDMTLLTRRPLDLSPLTLPSVSEPESVPQNFALLPSIPNVIKPTSDEVTETHPDTALATSQPVRIATRRARGARKNTLNLASARDWTEL